MKFGIEQQNTPVPSTIVKVLAAVTLFCQALPPIMASSEVITQHTANVISLICDIINVGAAAVAVLFGVNQNTNP